MTRERKQDLLVIQWLILVFVELWVWSPLLGVKLFLFGLILTGSELLINRFQRDWARPPLAKLFTGVLLGTVFGLWVGWAIASRLELTDAILLGGATTAIVSALVAGLQPKDRR